MVVFEGTVNLGLVLLASVALAEWAKIRQKFEYTFKWLAVSGILFLLAGIFALPPVINLTATLNTALVNTALNMALVAAGKIAALVSAAYLVSELFGSKRKR